MRFSLCTPHPVMRMSARLAASALLALAALGVHAQVAPMPNNYSTIQAQIVKPNMLIIQDITGSLSWDMTGTNIGGTENNTGSWSCLGGGAAGCTSSTQYRWVYNTPSRAALIKNVLGDAFTVNDVVPPPPLQLGAGGKLVISPMASCVATAPIPSGCTGAACTSCGGVARPAAPTAQPPSQLLTLNSPKMNLGLVEYSGDTPFLGAGSGGFLMLPNDSLAGDTCQGSEMNAYYKPAGTVTTTPATCTPNPSVSIDSIVVGNAACTRTAVDMGTAVHKALEFGTAQTYNGCYATATVAAPPFGADQKRSCNRPLFNMLVTDGESNNCNNPSGSINYALVYPAGPVFSPNNNETPLPGGAVIGPPRAIQDAYNNGNNTGANVSVRTFVLGVSLAFNNPAKSFYELNEGAYFGRTDGADPYNNAGILLVQAYDSAGNRLCVNAAGTKVLCTATISTPAQYPKDPFVRTTGEWVADDGPTTAPFGPIANPTFTNYFVTPNQINQSVAVLCNSPAGKPKVCQGTGYQYAHRYYFPAANRQELINGLKTAFDAVGAGDYTSETPTITAATTGTTTQNFLFTASTEFPAYKGHLRAQDLGLCVDINDAPISCSSSGNVYYKIIWDAGDTMGQLTAAQRVARRVYIPDITALPLTDSDGIPYLPLVRVNAANAATIASIYTSAVGPLPVGVTGGNLVDFMLGFTGTGSGTSAGTPRSWILGDISNSSPFSLDPPGNYNQGTTLGHTAFQTTYATRHNLLLLGASDGAVHAFDANSAKGDEIWAFVPPDSLAGIAKMVQYIATLPFAKQAGSMGQYSEPDQHVYGVASPVNSADMDLLAPTSATAAIWRTVAVGGLGKAGRGLYALDVTHSWCAASAASCTGASADPNYGDTTKQYVDTASAAAPIKVLWYKSKNTIASMGETWSSPSISLNNEAGCPRCTLPNGTPVKGRWVITAGSGPAPDTATCGSPPCPANPFTYTQNGNSTYTVGVNAYAFSAKDGSLVNGASGLQLGTSDMGALMSATTMADNVSYSTSNISFVDQAIDRIYQGSTDGRLWEINASAAAPTAWTASAIAGTTASRDAIYYAPAIGYYKDSYGTTGSNRPLELLSWPTGSYFEGKPQINNLSCGPSPAIPCYAAKIMLHVKDLSVAPVTPLAAATTALPLTSLGYDSNPLCGTPASPGPPAVPAGPPCVPVAYSVHARVIGTPTLFIPVILDNTGTGVASWPKATDVVLLYTIYDPQRGSCIGESSFQVIKIFGNSSNAVNGSGFNAASATGYFATAGPASSPVIYQGNILVNVSSRSGPARGTRTGPPLTGAPPPNYVPFLESWREVF